MSFPPSGTGKQLLCRWSLRLTPGRLHMHLAHQRRAMRCVGASSTSSSFTATVHTPHRAYYWPYPENFIPEGATTSSFQSSPVPSVRERVFREYALSPLFGSRIPCCVLGFAEPASVIVGLKSELRRCVAQVLGKPEVEVELGPLVQTKEMMLHRSGTDESPRLADSAWSRPDAELRRRSRYARLPVQARTLVTVYLPGEEGEAGLSTPHRNSSAVSADNHDASVSPGGSKEIEYLEAVEDGEDAEATILAHGWFLQEQLHKYMSSVDSKRASRASVDDQQNQSAHTDEGSVEASVAALHDQLGVIYCEVPAIDESGFLFDQLYGKEVDADMAARVVDRWTRRISQQQERAALRKPTA